MGKSLILGGNTCSWDNDYNRFIEGLHGSILLGARTDWGTNNHGHTICTNNHLCAYFFVL